MFLRRQADVTYFAIFLNYVRKITPQVSNNCNRILRILALQTSILYVSWRNYIMYVWILLNYDICFIQTLKNTLDVFLSFSWSWCRHWCISIHLYWYYILIRIFIIQNIISIKGNLYSDFCARIFLKRIHYGDHELSKYNIVIMMFIS